MEYKLGIDVDGVLCNFIDGYCDLAQRLHGITLPRVPDCWDWWEKGMTQGQNKEIWKWITAHPEEFWGGLKPVSDENLQQLTKWKEQGHVLYCITTRPGKNVQQITSEWLRTQLGWPISTLVAAGPIEKGRIAGGLHLTHFVDDNGDNVREVIRQATGCRAMLYDMPHNASFALFRIEKLGDLTR